jgi:Reverse transcriptase (RNA-dependent DNA polymerase)
LDAFSPKTGTVPGWEFRIKVEDGAELAKLNRPVMRRSPMEQEVERREMQGLNVKGDGGTVGVTVGNGECVRSQESLTRWDFRRVEGDGGYAAFNSVTIGDPFPGEDIQTIINWFAGTKWFSVADLRGGYWNVELAPESRAYTALKTVIGLVQYTRMTMGLKTASAFFQRLMNHVYEGLKGTKLQAYLDDLAVGSDTPKQYIADVREKLERTRQGNLRLILAKCTFGKHEGEILGQEVAHRRAEPNDRHRDCLRNFKEPENACELLGLLGLLQCFSSRIERLAEIAVPLYEVLEETGWNRLKENMEKIQILDWDRRWGDSRGRPSGGCGMCWLIHRSWYRRDQGHKSTFARIRVGMDCVWRCSSSKVKTRDGCRWVLLVGR